MVCRDFDGISFPPIRKPPIDRHPRPGPKPFPFPRPQPDCPPIDCGPQRLPIGWFPRPQPTFRQFERPYYPPVPFQQPVFSAGGGWGSGGWGGNWLGGGFNCLTPEGYEFATFREGLSHQRKIALYSGFFGLAGGVLDWLTGGPPAGAPAASQQTASAPAAAPAAAAAAPAAKPAEAAAAAKPADAAAAKPADAAKTADASKPAAAPAAAAVPAAKPDEKKA